MKKSGKILLSAVMATVMSFCIASCAQEISGDSSSPTDSTSSSTAENKLTFEVKAELNAEVGDYFQIPEAVCKDSEGNRYFPEVTVTDAANKSVAVEDGKFFIVLIGEYRIKYSVEFGGETIVKETKVTATDGVPPTIKLAQTEVYELQGTSFTIPQAQYADNCTKTEDLQTKIEVLFDKTPITPPDGVFTLDNAGRYTVTYTATDASGNTEQAVLTVNSVAKEEGNLTYFDKSFGVNSLEAYSTNLGYVGTVSESQEKTIAGEEYSLKYEVPENGAPAGLGGFYVRTPFVRDVSAYKYLYFYVYTEQSGVGVTFNGVYSTDRVQPGVWRKIVLIRQDNGSYKTSWGTDAFMTGDPVTPQNMTNFLFLFYLPAAQTTIYTSAMRGTDELPAAEIDLADSYAKDAEFDIPKAIVDGEACDTTAYILQDGKAVKLTTAKYKLASEGQYTFLFEVVKDGKLVDVVQKTVMCYTQEPGNITYFNQSFGVESLEAYSTNLGYVGTVTASQEKTVEGEEYSLKYEVPENGAPAGLGGFYVRTPFVRDVSAYKYLYFYVYTEQSGVGVTFNGVWSGDRVQPGVWSRIVLIRQEDGSYKTSWGTNVFMAESAVTPQNMTDFLFLFYVPAGHTAVYVSTMRGANEMPEASVELADSFWENEEFTIPTATGIEGAAQKVYVVRDGQTREITENVYAFEREGEYLLAFEVYKDGRLVDIVTKKVICYAQEEGNVTYFNREFGAENVDVFLAVGSVSASNEKTIAGEEYALKYEVGAGVTAGGIVLKAPYITNISDYRYLYFYVYTDQSGVGVSPGAVFTKHRLEAGRWTKVVLTRTADGSNYTTPWGMNVFQAGDAVTPENITNLLFYLYLPDTGATVYFSAIRGANELSEASVDMASTYRVNEEFDIPRAAMTGAEGLTQKVCVIKDGTAAEVTAEKYKLENEGVYTFVFEVSVNGRLQDVVTKKIVCHAGEEGNVTYFNKSYGAQLLEAYNAYGHLSMSKEKTLAGEEYALKYDGDAGAPAGAGGLYLKAPYITDISAYKYLYFSVYTDQADVGVTFNGNWSPNRLTAGQWTQIVLTRQENGSYTTPWGTNVFGDGVTPQNMTNFQFFFYVPATACTIYFSTMRASNTLPTA